MYNDDRGWLDDLHKNGVFLDDERWCFEREIVDPVD